MKIITALLALNLVAGYIYHFMVVDELNSQVFVQQELFKACTAQNMWLEMQLNDAQ